MTKKKQNKSQTFRSQPSNHHETKSKGLTPGLYIPLTVSYSGISVVIKPCFSLTETNFAGETREELEQGDAEDDERVEGTLLNPI